MNLLIFCRFLGVIRIEELDLGNQILVKINALLDTDEPPFDGFMDGKAMISHYRTLRPSTRVRIDELDILDKQSWVYITRQLDYLTATHDMATTKEAIRFKNLYVMYVVVLFLITAWLIGNYYTLLELHGEKPTSRIVDLIGLIINLLY